MNTAALTASIAAVFAKVREMSDNAANAQTLEGKTVDEIALLIAGETGLTTKSVRDSLTAHTERTDNPHAVTATQVGLGNVADFGMATDVTILEKVNATEYVNPKVLWTALENFWSSKAGTAPETLDTINEIAAALQNNPDVIETIQNGLAAKASTVDLTAAIAEVNDQIDALVATELEVMNGVRNDVFVTPLTLKAKTDAMDLEVVTAFGDVKDAFDDALAALVAPAPAE